LEGAENSGLSRLETLREYFKNTREWMASETMSPLDGQKKDNYFQSSHWSTVLLRGILLWCSGILFWCFTTSVAAIGWRRKAGNFGVVGEIAHSLWRWLQFFAIYISVPLAISSLFVEKYER
jgi:hypothetical protein